MTTANEHLKSIQSRIDELEQTISERGEQIRTRAQHLKKEIQEELAPEELVRKHPFKTTGVALLTGLLIGRIAKSVIAPSPRPAAAAESLPVVRQESSALKTALAAVGAEALHAGKDLAITWLRNYIEEKKKVS
ncbi:MAG: hypothetical protein HGB04_05545 [Chlorobiaceae bacterium]|nr:hypothetical protein [Chlorobiaceae bacterium]